MNLRKTSALILWIASLLTSAASDPALPERTTERTFEVQPGGTLKVEVDRGMLEIRGADTRQATIRVVRELDALSAKDAARFIKEQQLSITQDGNSLSVTSKGPNSTGLFALRRLFSKARVRYQITLPYEFHTALQTSGGAIQVRELQGNLNANTAGGSLEFEKLAGSIAGSTSGGSIRVLDSQGQTRVHTSGGSIRISNLNGPLTATTSGGSITIQKVQGDSRLETSGGSIHVTEASHGVEASTSGGGIQATFLKSPDAPVRLETSGGGIQVALPSTSQINLDAQTSGGGVTSDLPVTNTTTGKQQRNHLQGTINGGGATLHLRTSGGSIRVRSTPQG